ncbi:hypothetical protein BDV93DRAFT_524240 [Ceratobasidium sp. AG-I]|nr:hypothetical protein BDV93DRAFT_524240 [Ceratobasidium sp. AG-I]
MPPILSYAASLLHPPNQSDIWVSTASDASRMVLIMFEGFDASSMWTWFVGLFLSIGSWFTEGWQGALSSIEEGASKALSWLSDHQEALSEFFLQPHIQNVLIVWFMVFSMVLLVPLILGFGHAYVVATSGSVAPISQPAIHDTFKPTRGFFEGLTSIGTMGIPCWYVVVQAFVIASVAAEYAWIIQTEQ